MVSAASSKFSYPMQVTCALKWLYVFGIRRSPPLGRRAYLQMQFPGRLASNGLSAILRATFKNTIFHELTRRNTKDLKRAVLIFVALRMALWMKYPEEFRDCTLVSAQLLLGSYPVPEWLIALPSQQALIDATKVVFKIQELAGIDVIADGELYRWDVNHPRHQWNDRILHGAMDGIRSPGYAERTSNSFAVWKNALSFRARRRGRRRHRRRHAQPGRRLPPRPRLHHAPDEVHA